jgi:hypothetical protein
MEEWPHLRLPSATVVFFDDNGQQFQSISDVYINRQLAHGRPMISPADYNTGDLLFGQLQDFTTSPPSIMPTTLCRHIHGQLQASQVYWFPHPLRVMQMLRFQGTLLGAAIYAARYDREPLHTTDTNSYYINDYFGSCSYHSQFPDDNIHINEFKDSMGYFTIQLVDISGGAKLSSNGTNTWTMIQREDALIGEGGSVVTLPTRATPHGGINRPTTAQEEEALGALTLCPNGPRARGGGRKCHRRHCHVIKSLSSYPS